MKTSIPDFLILKISAGINWRYASRHFGKAFWILTLACVSCTANLSAPSMLPVTGAETNLAFLPELVDFGTIALGTSSTAQNVKIRNEGPSSLFIHDISVPTGFSIVSNSCPLAPEAFPIQGICTLEVVFEPHLAGNWMGYLKLTTDSDRDTMLELKGVVHSELDGLALVNP